MGLITAFMNVTLRAQQGISGIGVYIFGLGMSDLLFVKFVGTPLPVNPLPAVDIPLLSKIPAVGRMFFQQNLLIYLAFILVPALAFVLYHTNFGTRVLAVGENPAAADSLGINVARTRYVTVVLGGTMAGLAGATLLLLDGIFQENLTQSAGFIAVALVYFGAWRPAGRHDRVPPVRRRDRGGPTVEVSRDHPHFCRRPGRHGTGRDHGTRPGVAGWPVQAARRAR